MAIKDSRSAYVEIHKGMLAAVECALEDCDFDEAMKLAEKLESIEYDHFPKLEYYQDGTLKSCVSYQ